MNNLSKHTFKKALTAGTVVIVTLAIIFVYRGMKNEGNDQEGKTDENIGGQSESTLAPPLPPTGNDDHSNSSLLSHDDRVAIEVLNHASWVLHVIKSYNNKLALEEEYKKLTFTDLNLDELDSGLKDVIEKVSNGLHELTMNNDKREHILEQIQLESQRRQIQEVISTLKKTPSSQLSGNVGSKSLMDIAFIGGDAATSLAASYMNYKLHQKELEIQNKAAEYEFTQAEKETIDNLNKELLDDTWKIITNKDIDDGKYRISARKIEMLCEIAKTVEESPQRAYDQLLHAKGYENYPPYWFYLASAASKTQHHKEALFACTKYTDREPLIFKENPERALVAIYKISALLSLHGVAVKEHAEEIKKELKVIEKNDPFFKNCLTGLFCARIYYEVLDDPKNAINALKSAYASAVKRKEKPEGTFIDFNHRKRETKPSDENRLPTYEDIEALLDYYASIVHGESKKAWEDEFFIKVISSAGMPVFAKLKHIGDLDANQILERASEAITSIQLSCGYAVWGYKYVVDMPNEWFRLEDVSLSLSLHSGTNKLESIKATEVNRRYTHFGNRVSAYFDKIDCYLPRAEAFLRLEIKHNDFPVILYFTAPKLLLAKANADALRNDLKLFAFEFQGKKWVLKHPPSGSESFIPTFENLPWEAYEKANFPKNDGSTSGIWSPSRQSEKD